jgi:amidase
VVSEAAPTFDAMELWTKYTTLLSSLAAWMLADWSRRLNREAREEDFKPFVWAFADRGRALSAQDYLLAMQDVQVQVRAMSAFYETHDVWLTTTLGQPPVALGTLVYTGDPIELRRRMACFSPYTYLANTSGQPAISLPLHWSSDGLPIGLHFTTRIGEEDLLLRLAAQLEHARPWAGHRPEMYTRLEADWGGAYTCCCAEFSFQLHKLWLQNLFRGISCRVKRRLWSVYAIHQW